MSGKITTKQKEENLKSQKKRIEHRVSQELFCVVVLLAHHFSIEFEKPRGNIKAIPFIFINIISINSQVLFKREWIKSRDEGNGEERRTKEKNDKERVTSLTMIKVNELLKIIGIDMKTKEWGGEKKNPRFEWIEEVVIKGKRYTKTEIAKIGHQLLDHFHRYIKEGDKEFRVCLNFFFDIIISEPNSQCGVFLREMQMIHDGTSRKDVMEYFTNEIGNGNEEEESEVGYEEYDSETKRWIKKK